MGSPHPHTTDCGDVVDDLWRIRGSFVDDKSREILIGKILFWTTGQNGQYN